MITGWECHHSSSVVCQQLSSSPGVTSWLIVRIVRTEATQSQTGSEAAARPQPASRHSVQWLSHSVRNTPSSNTEHFLEKLFNVLHVYPFVLCKMTVACCMSVLWTDRCQQRLRWELFPFSVVCSLLETNLNPFALDNNWGAIRSLWWCQSVSPDPPPSLPWIPSPGCLSHTNSKQSQLPHHR